MAETPHYSYKILSLEASYIYNCAHNAFNTTDEHPGLEIRDIETDHKRFRGQLDVSLETIYMENENLFRSQGPDSNRFIHEHVHYTTALVSVSFKSNYKEFNKLPMKNGMAYVRAGYLINKGTDRYAELEENRILISGDGKTLIAVLVPHMNKKTALVGKSVGYTKLRKQEIESFNSLCETDSLAKKYFNVQLCKNSKCLYYYNVKPPINCAKDEAGKEETSARHLRKELYEKGFYLNGRHYVRYKRSAGSGREGRCLFIEESLYAPMNSWGECGLGKCNNRKKFITGWEAYVSLTLSSLLTKEEKGRNVPCTVTIKPEEILVIPDGGASIKNEDERTLYIRKNNEADQRDKSPLSVSNNPGNTNLTNEIWDGQSLLDESVFARAGFSGKGMMLLRNRFFKSCAFNTKLGQWFKDNGITDISQLNRFAYHAKDAKLSDIKLIVTPSSIKYLKFHDKHSGKANLSESPAVAAWFEELKNFPLFGIVKTDAPTGHFGGELVSTNYQLLNTLKLNEDDVKNLLKESFDYLQRIKNDPLVLMHYLSIQENPAAEEEDDYETPDDSSEDEDLSDSCPEDEYDEGLLNYKAESVLEMLKANKNFAGTAICRDWLSDYLSKGFTERLKRGRILINGTYATLFGNRAEMLLSLIDSKVAEDAGGFDIKNGHVCFRNNDGRLFFPEEQELKSSQISSKRFPDGTLLSCERSPHITMGNLFRAENCCGEYAKYFTLTDEIVCVNAINHNIQHRLNGCDYDSDTMLITDNATILGGNVGKEFAVPVNACKAVTKENMTACETDISISENSIGEIVNLSQMLNTIYWTMKNCDTVIFHDKTAESVYEDICRLAVLSGMEIDKAKRNYGISTADVLRKIEAEVRDPYLAKYPEPEFISKIKNRKVRKSSSKEDISCAPMSYLLKAVKKEMNDSRNKRYSGKKCTLSELCGLNGKASTAADTELADVCRICEDAETELNNIGFRMRLYKKRESDSDSFADLMLRKEECLGAVFKKLNSKLKKSSVFNSCISQLDSDGSEIYRHRWLILGAMSLCEKSRLLRLLSTTKEKDDCYVLKRNRSEEPEKTPGNFKIYGMDYFPERK